jgi:hypothetical protein
VALPADTVVVSELKRRPGGLWECLINLPDGTSHRIVVPDDIANVSGVYLTAGVVAQLYAKANAHT